MKAIRRAFQRCTAGLVLWMVAANAAATEEELSVDLQADRTNVNVAEPTWITLSATAPKGWRIQLPDAPDGFEELKVTETVDRLQESDTGTVTASTRLKLESLLPGRYQVGPLDVQFTPDKDVGDGDSERSVETIQRSTRSITIEVHSALGFFDSRRLRDIYGAVSIPWTWWRWAVTAMVLVAAFVFGWVVYQRIDRWLRSERVSQRSLFRQLDRLDEARLDGTITNDRLIVSVADVVRQSLRLVEGIPPVYRTTDEWIGQLQEPRFARAASSASNPRLLPDAVELVLREADAIKFAGKAATIAQARRCLDAARIIVGLFRREVLPADERNRRS